MEGNVVSSYLRSKFSSTLKETEADVRISSQIKALFGSIEMHISGINDHDLLYELMEALSECTIFADEAASNKGFNLLRVVTFEKNMRNRLKRIGKGLIRGSSAPDIPSSSLLEGFESQAVEIEEMLMPPAYMDSGFIPVGILGRSGCGKTALVRKVFSSGRVEELFFPRIWVGLSELMLFGNEGSDLRERIVSHILRETGHDALDLEYSGYSVVQLLEKLRRRLVGKRYLIVLDDAWRMDEWLADLACTGRPGEDSFTHGLPKGSGGAVIVTSRAENVIRRVVGENHVIRPHLRDDICWKTFNYSSGED